MKNFLKQFNLFVFILFLFVTNSLFSYRENLYPDNIILLEKNNYAFLVEKKSQKMYVYRGEDIDPLMVFTITTGKNNGDKLNEGDEKTPEGVYFFTKILEGKKLPPLYGIRAFVMNYPNPYDLFEGKSGSGIWLHGAEDPFKPLTPFSTKGCVAMRNADLIKVSPLIILEKTPIINVEEIKFVKADKVKKMRDFFENLVLSWKKGWESRDINKYISFYSKKFRNGSMDYYSYKKFKQRLNKIYKFIRIKIKDLEIFKTDKYLVTAFYQQYRSDRMRFNGIKRLYWIKENGSWKIIRENALANKKWQEKKTVIRGKKLLKIENFGWENDPLEASFKLSFTLTNGLSTPVAGYVIVKIQNEDNSGFVFLKNRVKYFDNKAVFNPRREGRFFKILRNKRIKLAFKYGKNFFPKDVIVEIYDLTGVLVYSERINL